MLILILALLIGSIGITYAQDDVANTTTEYASTPKHAWEVGVNLGFAFVTGDIDWKPGFGAGLHVRRALDHVFSVRVNGTYYRLTGFEKDEFRNPDGQVIKVLRDLGYGVGAGRNNWVANYQTTLITGSVQGVMSLNQFRFLQNVRKWNIIAFVGLGVGSFDVKTDALNGNAIYNFGPNYPDAGDLDGDYETELVLTSDDLGDSYQSPMLEGGLGIAYRISKRMNLALEAQSSLILGRADDFIDGHYQRTINPAAGDGGDETNNRDQINYVNLRLNFNLGNLDEKAEPLYWTNPLAYIVNDIAELKARPKLDLTDSDGDGVIDMLDQEPDTPEGCPVDTRGIALDSDSDGIMDCKDKEPYSPIGYDIDAEGVAQVPAPDILNDGDVNRMIDVKLKNYTPSSQTTVKGMTDWFLPMIHFNFNRHDIRNVEYGNLHSVATVMKNNPDLMITVSGHTDKTSSNCYNDKLSYKRASNVIDYLVQNYGISRSRLVLNWSGEGTTLVPTESKNLMNRRVEFSVNKGESDMGMPDCSGSSPRGYSGNKEAGY